MPLRKDIWRPAIIEAPLATIIARGGIAGLRRHWLPEEEPFRFLADPFGLWRDERLHVFVECFDYRDRIGRIEVLIYDAAFRLLAREPALAEPWHLSYPFVFEGEGDVWMLPEAHRSGRLTLYWAARFPDRWERAGTIALPGGAVDASPLWRDGRWWLFYSPAGDGRTSRLNIASADRLTGPWAPHPANPAWRGSEGARPGGTPCIVGDAIILPVQDCTATYGGAIRLMHITTLTPDRFAATLGARIGPSADAAPFSQGLHTLAAAGPVTLLDMKRTILSARGLGVELRRHLRRARGRIVRQGGASA